MGLSAGIALVLLIYSTRMGGYSYILNIAIISFIIAITAVVVKLCEGGKVKDKGSLRFGYKVWLIFIVISFVISIIVIHNNMKVVKDYRVQDLRSYELVDFVIENENDQYVMENLGKLLFEDADFRGIFIEKNEKLNYNEMNLGKYFLTNYVETNGINTISIGLQLINVGWSICDESPNVLEVYERLHNRLGYNESKLERLQDFYRTNCN